METIALAVISGLAAIAVFLVCLLFKIAGGTRSSPRQIAPGIQVKASRKLGPLVGGGTSTIQRTATRHNQGIAINPVNRPYWELKHWKVKGNSLTGFYRTPYGSIEGYITHWRSTRPQFYIVKPPQELRAHAHWVCFHPIGRNSFSIHFLPAPPNPDAGILAVEQVLAEALSQ